MLTMLACSYPNYRSEKEVFLDDTNYSGWQNRGVSWTLCFVNSLYGFLGTDAGVHMSEEIPNPSVDAPKVIVSVFIPTLDIQALTQPQLYPVLIGLFTVFPFASTCMFVIKDMDAILNAPSGLPLIQLYHQATESKTAALALMIAFTICFFACAVANVTGASRQVWSGARDECFPRSDLWKQISSTYQMPLKAALLQGAFATVRSYHEVKLVCTNVLTLYRFTEPFSWVQRQPSPLWLALLSSLQSDLT